MSSLTLFVFIFIFPLCYCSSNFQWYENCGNNFTCGNVTAGFPFWGGSLRPKDCGYPGFNLTCEANNATKFEMKGMRYHVLEINQISKVLKLVREDFEQGLCLQKFENTTLDFEFFSYAQESQNITVFYGCTSPETNSYDGTVGAPLPAQFTCRINGVSETTGTFQSGASSPNGCHASVVVPIMESLETQINSSTLSPFINQGFDTVYKVQDDVEELCTKCGDTKGRCGYDLSTSKATCLCPNGNYGSNSCDGVSKSSGLSGSHKVYKIAGLILAVCFTIGIGIAGFLVQRSRKAGLFNRIYTKDNQVIEDFFKTYGSLAPKRYSYKVLKKFTDSFRDKLGEGGYGTVYRGKLQNGDHVAVKLLKESKGSAEEFINEVTSIGRTNHVNVVTLLGFCFEGHKKALVYDFMPNGSLEKFIYGKNDQHILASDKLFNIAVGIGRGLEYLHRGCNTRIVHFDIKPHNILLDANLCPKISDFGMAKYCQKNESILSMSGARGTVGFIAPELILNGFGGVSHKSDVYSYGMLVLDMVGYRQNMITEVQHSSEQYFPHWIYKRLEQQQSEEVGHQDIPNGLDQTLRKMILVSLWCIQTNPSNRPAMSKVVDMLEGPLDTLQIPPMSYLSYSQSSQPGALSALVITHSENLEVLTA